MIVLHRDVLRQVLPGQYSRCERSQSERRLFRAGNLELRLQRDVVEQRKIPLLRAKRGPRGFTGKVRCYSGCPCEREAFMERMRYLSESLW